jgi:hypothetical protein
VLGSDDRQPVQLRASFQAWRRAPALMRDERPCRVFAVIGQARADAAIAPEVEGRVLSAMLRHWALRGTLQSAAGCRPLRQSRAAPPDRRAVYAVN